MEHRKKLKGKIKELCAKENAPVTDQLLSSCTTEEQEQLLHVGHEAKEKPVSQDRIKVLKPFRYLHIPKVALLVGGTAGIWWQNSCIICKKN